MTVVNFNYPKFKYTISSTGQPGAGYKLFTYEEGTSTKQTTWTTLDKTAENTNPIILDANGEADVWLDGSYKMVLAPPTDTDPPTSPVWTVDDIRSLDTEAAVATVVYPINGSFETDTDADGVPDNWTVASLSGGTIVTDSSLQSHGKWSLNFTSTGNGGGSASTDDYYEVESGKAVGVRFSIISADATTLNKVEVYWYDKGKDYLSSSTAYSEGAANPTTWTRKYTSVTAPATAKYARVVLTGVDAASTTHSYTNFDNIELDTEFTGEITPDPSEINVLDGMTATTAELNKLDGATASTTELNYVTGVTSSIQTQLDQKGWTWLETWTPTAVASKDFTWNESIYSDICIVVEGISPDTDSSAFRMQFGHGDGATIITSSNYVNNYTWLGSTANNTITTTFATLNGTLAGNPGNDVGEGVSSNILITGFGSNRSPKTIEFLTSFIDTTGASVTVEGNTHLAVNHTTVFDTVRFLWSGGNFTTNGKIYVYGLKRA